MAIYKYDNNRYHSFINTLIKEGRNRMSGLEKKFATKSKIVNYIINRESTSKVEISKELNLSMPTVLSNVKDLLEKGIIIETGEYESTGGRKAKSIGINPSYRYAMGIVITANHLGMVLVNLKYEIVKSERIRLKFVSDMSYCSQVADFATKFLDHMNDAEQKEKLLGVGISIPGIINQEQKLVIKSHALKLENYSLSFLEQAFSVPVYFSNDANAAMMAEDMNIYQNAIYLSLNQTLGGAFCIGGNLFSGENQKAGEFGHMILVPQGRKCYCGKSGCADAYCAAGALVGESKDSVEQFMQLLQNNDEKAEKKESYTIRMMITVLNLVYLVFCFTQIKVLFTEQNIKYSEFARKGFFQLMIVSLINIVMILKANNKNLRETEKQEKYKKTMCIVMVIFTLVIIISAFARMTLYQQNYGYTRLRVLVDLTLITEIILLIPTVIYILENKINLIKTYFVIIVTMYCIVNFVNIDKFIVKNNINRYKETGNIDLNYLIEMNNTDLVEQLLELDNTEFKYSEKLYSQSNIDKQLIKEKIERQKKMLDEYLTNLKKNLNETYTVAEFNLPKMRAKSILNNRK